ncbi:MAG: hypothetical protein PPP58_00440 [Natronomonas sp.]
MTTRPPVDPGGTLLVDLDGVVAEQLPRLCVYLDREYDLDIAPRDVDRWTYPVAIDGYDHIGDVIHELMWEHPEWYFSGMDPAAGVAETLSALSRDYRIEIATHRVPETHDVSKAWLETHGIPYDAFHDEVPENKGRVPGDALIDDYHRNVANAIDSGKEGLLMCQPYSDPTVCDGAHVVDSWDDVRSLFEL